MGSERRGSLVEADLGAAGEAGRPASEEGAAVSAVEVRLARRRRTFRFGALLVLLAAFIDLFQPRLAEVSLVRALWIFSILFGAALQKRDRPRLALFGAYLGAVGSGLSVVTIVALTGGTRSIYQGMLIGTPFAVLVAIAELPLAAALDGVICVVGGAVMRSSEGEPASQVVSWLLLSSLMTALATWGTLAARRAYRGELDAERDRWLAQERLRESERQRSEAEHLAEVGRLAARVAHEVNNPLAVVKANVQWLGEAEHDPKERAEVLGDTLTNVKRILDAVHSVLRQTGERPYRGR